MTTFVNFVQPANSPFQTSAVLDNGITYTLTVPWNIYGQRYFLTCTDQQGKVMFNVPMVGSPDNFNINLSAGYFKTPIVFRVSSQKLEIG